MKLKTLCAVSAAAIALTCASAANAALVFVGSWNVYNDAAPSWSAHGVQGPLAYTAQEAAALLFGGNASDYVISTAGDAVGDVDFKAWYDVIGFGGAKFAQDYDNKYLGQFYGPTDDYCCGENGSPAASAFIRDNLSGGGAINYAFQDDGLGGGAVPEPATWALMIGGFGLAGATLRRRKALAA